LRLPFFDGPGSRIAVFVIASNELEYNSGSAILNSAELVERSNWCRL
jgi:hypothetical protein